jgi:hypothetical protein
VRPVAVAALVVALALVLSGCSAPAPEAGPALFSADGVADYQLGRGYDPAPEVTIIARDSTEQPAEGLFSICYVNGFQTQPGEVWPEDLLLQIDGAPLTDPHWPDEFLIDVSSDQSRADAAARLAPVIERCATSGFDAVELDNLDSYTRSQGLLTVEDALAFAALLVEQAHDLGMAAGQKNTAELGARGRDEVGFDFAVVEECAQFDECSAYTDVYGPAVIAIEYADALARPFADVCADPATPPITVLRDRLLTAAGDPDHVFEHW